MAWAVSKPRRIRANFNSQRGCIVACVGVNGLQMERCWPDGLFFHVAPPNLNQPVSKSRTMQTLKNIFPSMFYTCALRILDLHLAPRICPLFCLNYAGAKKDPHMLPPCIPSTNWCSWRVCIPQTHTQTHALYTKAKVPHAQDKDTQLSSLARSTEAL